MGVLPHRSTEYQYGIAVGMQVPDTTTTEIFMTLDVVRRYFLSIIRSSMPSTALVISHTTSVTRPMISLLGMKRESTKSFFRTVVIRELVH